EGRERIHESVMFRGADPMPTNRREFLKTTAAAGGAALGFGGLAPARALGAGERLRVGVLGSGQRAQYLMSLFNKVPDVEIVAVCDVYEPHREKALGSASKDAQGTVEYREDLDRKDVDAVIIAAPDPWHKKLLLDAVQAGKDASCETPITHS